MDDYRPPEGKPHSRKWGCAGVVLGILALFFVTVYVCVFRSVPLRISKETTYITGPLKPDGKQVDYFAAWEQATSPPNIATDENGYRLIVEHQGKSPEATTDHFARLCKKLGLSADTLELDMSLQEPHAALQAYIESDDFDESLLERLAGEDYADREPPFEPLMVLEDQLNRPWTLNELPMMKEWLAENGPALDLIGQATHKPTFHIPMVQESDGASMFAMLLPEIQGSRSFARALSARANYRIGTGDIDGAIDDIVACKRLGRQIGPGGFLIQMLVGIAIEGIADSIGIAGSLEHPPTREQLERLARQLSDAPTKVTFAEVIPSERYSMLDAVQSMAHGGGGMEDLGIPTRLPRAIGIDWNVVTSRLNTHFDTMMDTGATPRPAWRLSALLSVRARSAMLADLLGGLALPASDAAREAARRSICSDRMYAITLAMLLYECDHKTLPPACTVDSDGAPLHSWRVLLLPYLGEQELYDKIRLDQPWNSQHNKQFHKQAIDFYQCPSASLEPGQTSYSVVVGADTAFQPGEGKALSQFGPKSAPMILVVEQEQPVCWMDPTQEVSQADAEAGINAPENAVIGSPHPGGALFGLRNGGVQFLSEQIDSERFHPLLHGTDDWIP